MIQLYIETGCPYCAKVLAAVEKYNIEVEKKNIADEGVLEELEEKGGKRQVPFMDDDNMTPALVDDDVEMYESDEIVAYLEEKFGNGSPDKPDGEPHIKIHISSSESMCPAHPAEKQQ